MAAEVQTELGCVRVEMAGAAEGEARGTVVLVPDIGLGAKDCFGLYLSVLPPSSPLSGFRLVMLDLPGMGAGDGPYPEGSGVTMEVLLECIEKALAENKVGSFIGIGSGMGSYLLAALACKNPRAVEALIMQSPACKHDWLTSKMAALLNTYASLDTAVETVRRAFNHSWTTSFLNRFFCLKTRIYNRDMLVHYHSILESRCVANIRALEYAYASRQDITPQLKALDIPVLILIGDGDGQEEAFDMNAAISGFHELVIVWPFTPCSSM